MAAPATPANLTVDQTASNAVKLSWDNVAGETGFRLYKSFDGGSTYERIADLAADTLTRYDMDCGESTQYYYKVSAYNDDGESALSTSVNTTTLARSEKIAWFGRNRKLWDENAIYPRETTLEYGVRSTGSMLVEENATSANEVPAYSQIPSAIPPTNASYIVVSAPGSGLSDYRVATAGIGITLTDGGAQSSFTLTFKSSDIICNNNEVVCNNNEIITL